MKVALRCQSPLLQNSLGMFLKDYLSDEGICDFIISDEVLHSAKAVCYVNDSADSHIHKPFTKESLLQDVQHFYENLQKSSSHSKSLNSTFMPSSLDSMETFIPPMSPPSYPHRAAESDLQGQIQELAQEFAQKVIALLESNRSSS